jgi:UDP-N-acetyl-D-glucosamine dehydrogenase
MEKKLRNICIQGLGFVGSAMAIAIAIARKEDEPIFNVIGIDLPTTNGKKRVDSINRGIFPFKSNDKDIAISLKRIKKQGNLRATTEPSVYSEADVIVVDIHLDISFHEDVPQLDLVPLKSAIKEITRFITPETLILIETTVPPGTCEKIIAPYLYKEVKKRGIKENTIYLAHSYERVMPGKNYLKSIIDYPRVYSGINEKSAEVCQEFLNEILNTEKYPLTRLSSTTASETAKVMENTYRAVNIAFIDEWTKYAEAVNIDLFEIIDAIRQRPTHSNIRFPGLGVGGYCLTKDPTFTPAASKELFKLELNFPFSNLAVQTNNKMPFHTASRLKNLLDNTLDNKKILICGITYRQDVADTRYSASEILAKELIASGAEVSCHDPLVNYWEEMEIDVMEQLPKTSNYDAIVLAVAHAEYKELEPSFWLDTKLILDANMVLEKYQINRMRDLGIKTESIGRGDQL